MPIIIFLSSNTLKIYFFDGKILKLVHDLQSESNNLDLANNFELIWPKIWSQNASIKKSNSNCKIYFLVSETSGFTNTRTVYIWLKTWQLLCQNTFFVHKVSHRLLLEILENTELNNFLNTITELNNQEILYSQEVRIGQKN